VADEFQTMSVVAAGKSLARFGDGELKMMFGQSYVREQASLAIATELFNVMNKPAPELIVGIPTMNPLGPKYENWLRHVERFEYVIQREGPWYSAFVTRPDSAPWIETQAYLRLVSSIWKDRHAVLLAEPTSKLARILRLTSLDLQHIYCPRSGSYAKIDAFEAMIVAAQPEIAVLSCGVTATCLANRLALRGVHAIDFGSVGGMLARLVPDSC
jgi:hypothetical protein